MIIEQNPEKVTIVVNEKDTLILAFQCSKWTENDTIDNYDIQLEVTNHKTKVTEKITAAVEKYENEVVVVNFPDTVLNNDTYRVYATKNEVIQTWVHGTVRKVV